MTDKARTFALLMLLSRVRSPRPNHEFTAVSGSGVEANGDAHNLRIVTIENQPSAVSTDAESKSCQCRCNPT